LRHGLLAALLALAACASRPGAEVLGSVSTPVPAGAKVVTVYVATTRALDPATGLFTNRRAPRTNFAEYTISVPPNHVSGQIEWPDGNPDPARSFVVLRQRPLSSAEFQARIAPGASKRRTGVFIHGFNVNFQEALFQRAQMSVDAGVIGVPVLFAWPSAGSLTKYVGDKDAVTASRDSLAEVLEMVARGRQKGEILVLGHSMGGWLTAETLRQLRLTGHGDVLGKLEVVLADPDVDVDVFRSQLAVIGKLQPPLSVLVARDDVALRISSVVAGDRQRVGNLDVNDPRVQAAAHQYGVKVIDTTNISSGDGINHSRFAKLSATLARQAEHGGVQNAGAFVFNSVGTVVSSPFKLVGHAIGGE